MSVEIISNPASAILPILGFAVGLTAITFIAVVLFLDLQPADEPMNLPSKR